MTFNLAYWLLQALAMWITALLIPRLTITSIFGPVLTVFGLALVNAQLWDAALFFQIPNSFGLHAVLLLLANGIIFWTLVKLLPGIEIEGLLPAVAAPVVFTVCSLVIDELATNVDWNEVGKTVLDGIAQLRTYFAEKAVE